MLAEPGLSSFTDHPSAMNSGASSSKAASLDLHDSSMVSHNDDGEDGGGKRRRVQRACDTCRKKKIRCDGLQPEKGACSNCANCGLECTFVDAARRRAPPRSYVEAIETRLLKMERLVSQLAPGVDFTDQIGKPVRRPEDKNDDGEPGVDSEPADPNASLLQTSLDSRDSPRSSPPKTAAEACQMFNFMSTSHTKARSGAAEPAAGWTDEDEDDEVGFLETAMEKCGLGRDKVGMTKGVVQERPHFGHRAKGGGATAIFRGTEELMDGPKVHRFMGKASNLHILPMLDKIFPKQEQAQSALKQPRADFWTYPRGYFDEEPSSDNLAEIWPEPDLADALIDIFFERVNIHVPIMNEAQFRHEYTTQPELRQDYEWSRVAICIFMVGSMYLGDPRTLIAPDQPFTHGFKFWSYIKSTFTFQSPVKVPIREVQLLALCIFYQLSCDFPATTSWTLVGVIIRLLQEYGIHRKQTPKLIGHSRLEAETMRRLFWVCYAWDRELSAHMGRPFMLNDEDIDLELPLEVDDEYIYAAEKDGSIPVQPAGKPANISAFVSSLRLYEIIGRTLRSVYAIPATKARYGFIGKDWDQRIVAEIDSALNNWLETVPDHLRYNPNLENDTWLAQSSTLHLMYYHCQILVHRPFIFGDKSKSSFNFPSLAICTNAARSISHIVDNLKDRGLARLSGPQITARTGTAATILLLVVRGAKISGGRMSTSAMNDLRRTLDVLRDMETQWRICGKFGDILDSLISMCQLPVPSELLPQGKKRGHGDTCGDAGDPRDPLAESGASVTTIAQGGNQSGNDSARSKSFSAVQLPLSTYQLAFTSMNSSAEPSPADQNTTPSPDATNSTAHSDPSLQSAGFSRFGPTGQSMQTVFPGMGQMPQDGNQLPWASFLTPNGQGRRGSYGMMTPLGLSTVPGGLSGNMPGGSDAFTGAALDFGMEQISFPGATPSMFDDAAAFGGALPPAPADMGGPQGPAFLTTKTPSSYLAELPADAFGTAQPGMQPLSQGQTNGQYSYSGGDSSSIANYAIDLLQRSDLWGLDDEYYALLQQQEMHQQRMQQQQQQP